MGILARLDKYRERAANPKYNSDDWRELRFEKYATFPQVHRSKDGARWFVDQVDSFGEVVGEAHSILGLRTTGYFADYMQFDVIKAHVVKFRTAKGIYYVPATDCDGWDGATWYMDEASFISKEGRFDPEDAEELHDSMIRSAARDADRLAEIEAEECRNAWLEDRVSEEIGQAKYDMKYYASQYKILKKGLKEVPFTLSEVLLDAVQERLKQLKDYIDVRARKIKKLQEDPFSLVNNY